MRKSRPWHRAVGVAGLVVTLGGVGSVWAELWTNAAGHALEATWVSGDGQNVVLARPNGAQISLPLLSLSSGAQQTAKKYLEAATPASQKKVSPGPSGPIAARARALYAADQISAEELQVTLDHLPPAAQRDQPVKRKE